MYVEHRFNRSKKEEVIPRYKLVSLFIIEKNIRMRNLKKKTQNFEPQIHYVVEQKIATQGIKMSRRVESIFVTKQETIVLPRVEPMVVEGVLVVVKVRYSEPKLNQQSGSIVRKVPRDWSKGSHSVNRFLRPNPPRCTYCYQIEH